MLATQIAGTSRVTVSERSRGLGGGAGFGGQVADGREQAIAVGAERLKRAAADQNVYMSLARAAKIATPVIDAVAPLLLSEGAIERARVSGPPTGDLADKSISPLLSPADEIRLREERFHEVVRRISRAAALHDLSDLPVHGLPDDLRAVMAAYADCQLHLRKAASLLERIAAQHQRRAAQQVVRATKARPAGRARDRAAVAETARVIEPAE